MVNKVCSTSSQSQKPFKNQPANLTIRTQSKFLVDILQMVEMARSRHANEFFFYKFPRYPEIQRYLRNLEETHPLHVRVENIGESHFGQSIDMIVICDHLEEPKWGILIDAGIHAREWITNTSALYVISYVLRTRELLKYFDFYVIPCLNPDGYEYTHTKCRLWRKNLRKSTTEAVGVDLNRNFPFHFSSEGGSDDPNSNMYRGEYPLSEPESQSLADVMTRYEAVIKLYISLHTYGNCIMYPWGYTPEPPPDEDVLRKCGNAARRAMYACNGRKYRVASVAKAMYIASGSTADYAHAIHDIKFSYCIELQEGGASGFTISQRKIREIGEEVTVGIEAMAKFVFRYFRKYFSKQTKSDRFFAKERKRDKQFEYLLKK